MNKFTFKKQRKEGTYRAFQRDMTDIKLKKKVCGHIYEKENGKYKIQIAVEKEDVWRSKNPNCTWKWIFFIEHFENEEAARNAIQKHAPHLLKRKLHFFE